MIRDRKVSWSIVRTLARAGFALLFVPLLAGCASASVASKEITAEQAWTVVKEKVLENQLEGKMVYVSPSPVKGGAVIKSMIHEYRAPESMPSAWVVFIDDAPSANWEHPCRYVFVDSASGEHRVLGATSPPDDLDTYARVYPKR
jgi:hypothetical protein